MDTRDNPREIEGGTENWRELDGEKFGHRSQFLLLPPCFFSRRAYPIVSSIFDFFEMERIIDTYLGYVSACAIERLESFRG